MGVRLLCALLCVLSLEAFGVTPEPGIYWRPDEPGRAYYIDYQQGTVFLVVYAYENGVPVFYSGSGPFREGTGEIGGLGLPAFSSLGYEPWNYSIFDLFRTTGGACVTCPTAATTSQKIGSTALYFDRTSLVIGAIQLDNGQAREFALERFNFAFPDTIQARLKDISGDWVFVNKSDPGAAPLRFNFTVREQTAPVIDRFTARPWELRLIDPVRNARWVCIGDLPGLDPTKRPDACELRVNGEPILWARFDDISLNRILAGSGPIRALGERFRGPNEIVGTRVQ